MRYFIGLFLLLFIARLGVRFLYYAQSNNEKKSKGYKQECA